MAKTKTTSRIALISRMLCFDRSASLLSDSFKALPGLGGGLSGAGE